MKRLTGKIMGFALKVNEFSEERSMRLTRMVMKLFLHWKLTYEEQSVLLGMSTNTNTSISRYKRGVAHIRLNQDTYDRIRFILAIHQSLKVLFPMNLNLAYQWMKEPNLHFLGKTPLEIVYEEGFLGLAKVHDYLQSVKGE